MNILKVENIKTSEEIKNAHFKALNEGYDGYDITSSTNKHYMYDEKNCVQVEISGEYLFPKQLNDEDKLQEELIKLEKERIDTLNKLEEIRANKIKKAQVDVKYNLDEAIEKVKNVLDALNTLANM